MIATELPGYADAIAAGYTLYANAGDGLQAIYVKDTPLGTRNIVLTVTKGGGDRLTAGLRCHWMLVSIEVKDFSFPHKQLSKFEEQILACLPKE